MLKHFQHRGAKTVNFAYQNTLLDHFPFRGVQEPPGRQKTVGPMGPRAWARGHPKGALGAQGPNPKVKTPLLKVTTRIPKGPGAPGQLPPLPRLLGPFWVRGSDWQGPLQRKM